jgi:hypothetical protein
VAGFFFKRGDVFILSSNGVGAQMADRVVSSIGGLSGLGQASGIRDSWNGEY